MSDSLWPMNGSMPGFPALHHLLEFAQTHVHWVGDAIRPSRPLPPPSPPALSLSQHLGLFAVSQLFTSGGQSIEASASASVLPMNIQCWFSLGLTNLISLLPKGLSRVLQHHSLKASIPWCSAFVTYLLIGHAMWHMGSQFSNQGSNPYPLHWKHNPNHCITRLLAQALSFHTYLFF